MGKGGSILHNFFFLFLFFVSLKSTNKQRLCYVFGGLRRGRFDVAGQSNMPIIELKIIYLPDWPCLLTYCPVVPGPWNDCDIYTLRTVHTTYRVKRGIYSSSRLGVLLFPVPCNEWDGGTRISSSCQCMELRRGRQGRRLLVSGAALRLTLSLWHARAGTRTRTTEDLRPSGERRGIECGSNSGNQLSPIPVSSLGWKAFRWFDLLANEPPPALDGIRSSRLI